MKIKSIFKIGFSGANGYFACTKNSVTEAGKTVYLLPDGTTSSMVGAGNFFLTRKEAKQEITDFTRKAIALKIFVDTGIDILTEDIK